MADDFTGDPDSPHWWQKPMTLETLAVLQDTVRGAHEKGRSLACVTMCQVRIALAALRQRMEREGDGNASA